MGQGRFSYSDLFKMLNKCVGGWKYTVTKHSVFIWIGQRNFPMPKGPGVGLAYPRRVMIEDGYLVQLVGYFDLDRDCVKKHLPDLPLD